MGVAEHRQDLAEIKAQLAAACACACALEERLDRLLAAYDQPPPLLAVVHVPKTAGATTKVMLANAYSRDALRDAGNYVTGESKTEERVAFRGWLGPLAAAWRAGDRRPRALRPLPGVTFRRTPDSWPSCASRSSGCSRTTTATSA